MVGCVAAASYVRVGSVLRSPAHPRLQNCKPQWTMLCMQQQKEENTCAQMLVRAFREASATPLPLLRQVADAMTAEMYNGLASEGGSQQLEMLPTYVENLPTGWVTVCMSVRDKGYGDELLLSLVYERNSRILGFVCVCVYFCLNLSLCEHNNLSTQAVMCSF